jgi:hypothetical protein
MDEALIHGADCSKAHLSAPWQDLRSRIPANVKMQTTKPAPDVPQKPIGHPLARVVCHAVLCPMETLTDSDLDWLTTVENKLIRLRKREAANTSRLCGDITDAIEKVDWLRQMLAVRFNRKVDSVEA